MRTTRILDVLDIVQPALYGVVISDNPDRIEFMKSTDQTHWIYEANAGVKERADTRYYWEMIWTAWELGFTGVGYWTFCTTGFDLWSAEADYVMVYQGADGPVPSVRWQAIRIGIEDYARMARLHDAIAHAEASGRGKAAANARSRIEGVVNEAKASLWDPAIVAGIRREVVDLTLNLRT